MGTERRGLLAIIDQHAVLLLLMACVVARMVVVFTDQGMLWGDEIYQSLAPAHRITFGYGIEIWEFREGLRSWFFPSLLLPPMALGSALGADSGVSIVVWAKLTIVVMQVLTALGAFHLARRLRSRNAGLLAMLLVIIVPLQVVYGSRAQSEIASQVFIVWAAVHALARDRRWSGLWVGILLGLAVFVRYQNGILLPLAGAMLLVRRDWRGVVLCVVGAGAVGLLGGLADSAIWGSFLHSFRKYWEFNFVQHGADKWGTDSWDYYTRYLASGIGPLGYFLFIGMVVAVASRLRGAAWLLAWVLVFWLLHAVTPHKELRFILPILPVALTLAAAGADVALERLASVRLAWTCLAVMVALCTTQVASVTLGELGYRAAGGVDIASSPFDHYGDVNRALSWVGEQDDVCGVTLTDVRPWWMGGFTYLHRDVPLFVGALDQSATRSNYVIARKQASDHDFTPVASFGDTVVQRRSGACMPRSQSYRDPME